MQIIDQKKLQRQLLAVERWRMAKGIGTFNFFTGVGKTYSACIVINKLFENNPSAHVIVIVPSTPLYKQWTLEIEKNITNKDLIKNIEIFTIQTLVENKYKIDTTLLVADEVHEYLTEERLKFLNKTQITYKYILGLTATWDDKENRQIYLEEICPIVDIIDEEEALREGFISEFIEYNIGVDLTPDEQLNYAKYTKIITDNLNKFGKGGLELAGLCLQGDKAHTAKEYCFMWATKHGWHQGINTSVPDNAKINNLWNPSKIIGYAKLLLNAIRDRKDILYSAENKIHTALEIVKKYPDLRTICFSQSTQFADRLAYRINEFFYEKEGDSNRCVVYHSKLETQMGINPKTGKPMKFGKKRLKDIAIKRIADGTATHISTASALDKGYDERKIRLGINSSSTQNPTQQTQRGGRVKRTEFIGIEGDNHTKEEKTKLIVNLYVRDSKDYDWLKRRQVNANTSRIYWVDSVNEINYNPTRDDVHNINEI